MELILGKSLVTIVKYGTKMARGTRFFLLFAAHDFFLLEPPFFRFSPPSDLDGGVGVGWSVGNLKDLDCVVVFTTL